MEYVHYKRLSRDGPRGYIEMARITGAESSSVEARFDAVRSVLRRECRRTGDERQAFEAFAERVSELHPTPGPARSSGVVGTTGGGIAAEMWQPTASRGVDDLDTIRRAYEETVMSVPFYNTEYGDEYQESVCSELGPEVAVAVTEPDCFTPAAKRALLASVERAARERSELIETCELERESVDEAADTLLPVAKELDSLDGDHFDKQRFGTLDAQRSRSRILEERCEEAAATRQEIINQQRDRHSLPPDEPDVCAYIYKDLDAAYPVLACCTDLARRAANLRGRIERAMSHRS
jgi:hypothetical protein